MLFLTEDFVYFLKLTWLGMVKLTIYLECLSAKLLE